MNFRLMHMKLCIQAQYSTASHEYNICRPFCKITVKGTLDYSVQLILSKQTSNIGVLYCEYRRF